MLLTSFEERKGDPGKFSIYERVKKMKLRDLDPRTWDRFNQITATLAFTVTLAVILFVESNT